MSFKPEQELWIVSILFGILLVLALFQMARIIYYKHKRFSFQFVFLTLCFLWTLLRAVYFVWITEAEDGDPALIVLFWIPMNIQFATFTLLVVYYASLVHRNSWQRIEVFTAVAVLYFLVNIAFFAVVIVYVVLLLTLPEDESSQFQPFMQGFAGILFLVLVVLLGAYGIRVCSMILNKIIPAPNHIRGKHSTVWLTLTTGFIVTIYFSRSIYDFFTIADLGTLYFSDSDGTNTYWSELLLVALYIMWEVTPIALVLLLFWKIPDSSNRKVWSRDTMPLNSYSGTPGNIPYAGAEIGPTMASSNIFRDPKRYDGSDDENLLSKNNESISTSSGAYTYQVPSAFTPYHTNPVYSTSNPMHDHFEE